AGGTWTPVDGAALLDNYSDLGTKDWEVPNDITADFSTKIRVIDKRLYSIRNIITENESAGFKIRGQFTVRQPDGNEKWEVGQYYTISWTNCGTIDNVRLEYSLQGTFEVGDTFLVDGLSAISNTIPTQGGTYSWQIPNQITYPADYPNEGYSVKVRVSDVRDTTITDTSTSGFKIAAYFGGTDPADPGIEIGGYPDQPGIQLDVGDPCTITWPTYGGTVENVKLEYSPNGTWLTGDIFLVDDKPAVSNTGSYVWMV
ncbi:unnamed protein product, partial [marine sediment metagenome]